MNTSSRKPGHRWPVALAVLVLVTALALSACVTLVEVTPTPRATAVTQPRPTSTRVVATPATGGASSGQQTWLVMLYQDADDQVLERDIYLDLNEAERVGSTNRVHIVAQLDRFAAGYSGDGNWTSAKRFYLTQDDDLERLNSRELQDLGEVDMSDTNTLIDFATWAMRSYPADKYLLILSDHGMGWPGGWTDPSPGRRAKPNIPLAQGFGSMMYLMDLDTALGKILANTGVDKFDVLGMDACLMAHIEVLSALEPYARYAVASQEVEPALGWAYYAFLSRLVQNPGMDGAQLAKNIVASYVESDVRILDDEARAQFAQERYGLMAMFYQESAAELARNMSTNVTLSAVDLSAIPAVRSALDGWVQALTDVNQSGVAGARTYARAFTSIFGSQVPASYLDLGSLVSTMQRSGGSTRTDAAGDALLSAIKSAVIAERHGQERTGSSGISIYFPNSRLYATSQAGAPSYTAVAQRFVRSSLWDDFLAFHYVGRQLPAQAESVAVPSEGATYVGPGAGEISIDDIELSSSVASYDNPVTLHTWVRGSRIGYIYLLVGYFDPQQGAIRIDDIDYILGDDNQEVNGVLYPDYANQNNVEVEVEWEPTVYAITDGEQAAQALVRPQIYGASPEQSVYSVMGIYTFASNGQQLYAIMQFLGDQMRDVLTYTESAGTGAARRILPQAGDTFTVLDRWLSLSGSNKGQTYYTQGDTLTFGRERFYWLDADPEEGEYAVGVLVEDLDGNTYEQYAAIVVQ